jgi:hypothetical protein
MLGPCVMICDRHGLGYDTSKVHARLYLISMEYAHVHPQAPPPSFSESTHFPSDRTISEREFLMPDALQTDRHIYRSHQYLPAAECFALSEHAMS